MKDDSQPEYGFAGGERASPSITRFDLSLHMASEEETTEVEARSAVFMAMSLSSRGSTLFGPELKRAEMRKEESGRERMDDESSRCIQEIGSRDFWIPYTKLYSPQACLMKFS